MRRLIHFRLCPHSRSIRLAFAELAIECELAEERPWDWRPEFLAVNPSGDLPVAELDDGIVLAGAYAISEYLGEAPEYDAARQDFSLFPGTPHERAEVRRLVDWFHIKLNAEVTRELLREKLHPRMRPELANFSPDLGVVRATKTNLRYHMSYVSYLADQRPWLAGNEMSFADLAAAAHLSCLDYMDEVPWDEFPVARDWYAKLKSRPSFRPLLTDRVPSVAPSVHYANLDF